MLVLSLLSLQAIRQRKTSAAVDVLSNWKVKGMYTTEKYMLIHSPEQDKCAYIHQGWMSVYTYSRTRLVYKYVPKGQDVCMYIYVPEQDEYVFMHQVKRLGILYTRTRCVHSYTK